MLRYEIRSAELADEDLLLGVARYLDTVNLPEDRRVIRKLLEDSVASFRGELEKSRRRYVFVLWDHQEQRIAGTSMVIAKLGHRDAPYIYFDVIAAEKYSKLIDKHFHHQILRIGYSYDGPTEIGGLIVSPEYRKAPERLGLLISYVRFLFIGAHRDLFEDEVLAELLPPLAEDGTSHLWEALGRHFTDMEYADADRLSSENKDFIKDLFPSGIVYASLMSPEAQAVIGQVGAQTRGVEKMLRRIGFRYAERIDPFDGGPHFFAAADEVTLIRDTTRGRVASGDRASEGPRCLIARESTEEPFFRAVATHAFRDGSAIELDPEAMAHLGLAAGDEIVCLPVC